MGGDEGRPRRFRSIREAVEAGIDVGAKIEIHRLLREYAAAGHGVIVVSSEMPELLGLCDRILVLHEGRLAGEVSGETATEQELIRLAMGSPAAALAGFDIERYRPALVCIEMHRQVKQRILDYFSNYGYVLLEKYKDLDPANSYFIPLR